MKLWIITLVVGLLLVGGIVAVNAFSSDTNTSGSTSVQKISCSSCGNSCTAEKSCGSPSCGAVTGTGSCGCGKK